MQSKIIRLMIIGGAGIQFGELECVKAFYELVMQVPVVKNVCPVGMVGYVCLDYASRVINYCTAL